MNVEMLPAISLPTPVLSLLAEPDGRLWAGGLGGVAYYHADHWTPSVSGLPLTNIAALVRAGQWLIAGGAEGIARTADNGLTWQPALINTHSTPIAALAVSPAFEQDATLLAATLTGGILRSEDAGQSWNSVNFGLSTHEITALLWLEGETMLAATIDGIYRSPNGGRAWREVTGTAAQAIAALARLADGRLLAALEENGLLVSTDGIHWTPLDNDLPADLIPAALCVLSAGTVLLSELDAGIFRSDDGGTSWTQIYDQGVFALAQTGDTIYAGSGTDCLVSRDSGRSFTALPRPPLHDLRHLVTIGQDLLVYGRYSGALSYEDNNWHPLTSAAPPLGLLYAAADGSLYASTMDGLLRWQPGSDWQTLLDGPGGYFSQLAMRADGHGWACSYDYQHLLRTTDGGVNWQMSASPFGVLPLMALEATETMVFGATYDPRQHIARMWRSPDDGVNWQPGAEVRSPWPLVATCSNPALVALGSMIVVQQADGTWQRGEVHGLTDFLVRQVVGSPAHLLALTTRGLLQSTDGGANWSPLAGLDLPADALMSIALLDTTVYVLLVGGEVASFTL